ncbi:MAG: molybdopterin-guanine dinucleotide biosynthesis protein [Myxococcales bacterium]|nr:molybdopterin-guanine dinucleotide biosynthesis protein [Myxococcales bacterium]
MIAAAIIAGGAGTRMGGAIKAGLEVDGRSIAARQLEVLRREFERVVVVANEPGPWGPLGVEVHADIFRGAGPLAGIHAALAATTDAAGVVCVGGDMPFLEPALLALLRDHAPEADAVVPRVDGFPQPLLARYDARCLPVIEARLRAGARVVHELFAAVVTAWLDEPALRAVDPASRSFTNVNTPDDLARVRRHEGEGGEGGAGA